MEYACINTIKYKPIILENIRYTKKLFISKNGIVKKYLPIYYQYYYMLIFITDKNTNYIQMYLF